MRTIVPSKLLCIGLAQCSLRRLHQLGSVAIVLFSGELAVGQALSVEEVRGSLHVLKALCEDGLLTADECSNQRANVLERLRVAEEADNSAWFCNYSGEPERGTPFPEGDALAFSEEASASAVVRDILDEAGLVANFLVRAANVPNAQASVRMGSRYVEYHPTFINNLRSGTGTNWAVYSVMAHEIGHHLQGHTLQPGGSRPAIELEADEYSGFILAKLGATERQALLAMRTFGSDSSSGTHPTTAERLSAIARGWRRGADEPSQNSQTGELPQAEPVSPGTNLPRESSTTSPYLFRCLVKGESVFITASNQVISPSRGGVVVGSRTHSTSVNCAFNLFDPSSGGAYCVGHNGSVYFGTPVPVGQCIQCGPSQC